MKYREDALDVKMRFLQVLSQSDMNRRRLRFAYSQYEKACVVHDEYKVLCEAMLQLEVCANPRAVQDMLDLWITAKESLYNFYEICGMINASEQERIILRSVIEDCSFGRLKMCFQKSGSLCASFSRRGELTRLSKSPEIRAFILLRQGFVEFENAIISQEEVQVSFYEEVKHFKK